MAIALDATYSVGAALTGVGVYSREILHGLARAHPEERFLYYYRPHRFLRSFKDAIPPNASRQLLVGTPRGDVFHALNQRVDKPGRRTVTTFHDLFVITGQYSTPEFRERFAGQARHAAARSDLIIAVSQFTANQVHELLGVERSRIRVIPHGTRVPDKLRAERHNLVLCVGSIQKRKNIAAVVKAFEKMPPGWRLILAGSPDGFGAQEELRAIEQSPRHAGIEVLGYVSPEALEDLYHRARIFLFPSLDEGFGMPVLDAMAHGLAVITSNRSAMPEVAGDAAVLVDPENPVEIAAVLGELCADDPLIEHLGRVGRERARQFTWESAVSRTWAVYQELR